MLNTNYIEIGLPSSKPMGKNAQKTIQFPANKIGGTPTLPSLAPPVICGACNSPDRITFLMQFHAPLIGNSQFPASASTERSLFVFFCRRESCLSSPKSLIVLRFQPRQDQDFQQNSMNSATELQTPHSNSSDLEANRLLTPYFIDFYADENDEDQWAFESDEQEFSDDDDDDNNDDQDEMNEKMKNKREKSKKEKYRTGEPCIDNEFKNLLVHDNNQKHEHEEDSEDERGPTKSKNSNQLYTRAVSKNCNKTDALTNYLNLRKWRESVLRYSFGGRPIMSREMNTQLVSSPLTSALTSSSLPSPCFPPNCANCNAPRLFEAQIFPNINNSLNWSSQSAAQTTTAVTSDGGWILPIRSVLLFSCAHSCEPLIDQHETYSAWHQECAIVQFDETVKENFTSSINQ